MRTRHLRDIAPMRRGAVVSILVGLVIALLSLPSSSAPGDPDVPGESDLPGLDGYATERGTVANSQGTVVRRSKMYITIGPENPIWGVFYSNLFNSPVDNPTGFKNLCSQRNPVCVPDPFEQPDCATSDPETQFRGAFWRYRLYPVSPRAKSAGGGVDVGVIARTRVNLLAFGSVPASATLTLTTPRVAGKVEPLRIMLWSLNRRGCETTGNDAHWYHAHAFVEGRVNIAISDLRVDGVPVDVGDSCRTARPAQLSLYNEGQAASGGYSGGGGGNLGAFDGLQKGSLGPLDSPLYYEDRGRTLPDSTGMTIPEFTGCKGTSDDLSPLVTAMASGPNNPVRVTQSGVVTPDGGVDLDDLEKCYTYPDGVKLCPTPPDAPPTPPIPAGEQ
ncbi:hypothetical protein ACJ5H2_04250 [Nocardioides sp. R1-1]|uniref:hypothetical protein n=1 Tax=Nocardioides sp. R1-1 TaxID=3383502 RepID=UPI0038CF9979